MGGKSKQSQRTKNNVKPSSSSRSAGLLSNTTSTDGGLTAGTGKVGPGLFTTVATVNLEQGLSPEYQMCIKKLNKKDPITRVKALQELSQLVNNGSVDDAAAALPIWAHFYKTLTADTDRKVREMTQLVHAGLVGRCGRRVAPVLRALLPAWLQAQHDEHAPAMAHANHSLQSTFPDAKLPDVISFCKSEIMAHLLENLIGNTEAIISKKLESPEERALALARVATSSLRGLEFVLPRLPAAQHAWLWEQLAPLLQSPQYWKLAAHTSQPLRAAWHGATGCAVERYKGQFAEQFGLRTVRVLLGAARDAAQRWTCLLQFMHNVEDWEKYLEKKELLVKRILDVLETGGWGDARHLSSVLLPLLAHLPRDLLTKEFYQAFFNAIYKGFDTKNILSSKSERQSWITSLSECLRYLSIQQHEFVVEVATGVHRTWVEKVLSSEHDTPTRSNLIKYSATDMTSLVKYWLKHSEEDNDTKYDQLLRNLWANLGSTVLAEIDNCSADAADIERLTDGHILLLQTMKTAFLQDTRKRQSIKFEASEDEQDVGVVEESPAVERECDASIVERYNHSLDELVYEVVAHYFEAAEKKQKPQDILGAMITLLRQWGGAGVYAAIARQLGAASPAALYHAVLRGWLAQDTMRCKPLLEIVFIMMNYLTEDEQDAVFATFNQFPPSVSLWGVALVVSGAGGRAAGRRWAGGALHAGAARTLAGRALQGPDRAAADLLLRCAGSDDAEPLLGGDAALQVVDCVSEELGRALEGGEGASLAWAGELAARLVSALAASTSAALDSPRYGKLLLQLFHVCLTTRPNSADSEEDPSPETLASLHAAWRAGLRSLPAAPRASFLRDAALLVRAQLLSPEEDVDIATMEHLVSPTPQLFTRGPGGGPPRQLGELLAFTRELWALGGAESLGVETCALRHDVVTARLNCLYDDGDAIRTVLAQCADPHVAEPTRAELALYLRKFLFRAISLRTLLLHEVVSDDAGEPATWCEALLDDKYIKSEFCNVLHDYAVVCSLHEGYAFWPFYNIVEEAQAKADALLAEVVGASPPGARLGVARALAARAAGAGYYWALAHGAYLQRALSAEQVAQQYELGSRDIDDVSGNGYFHMMQACRLWSSDPALAYQAAYVVMLRSWHAPEPALLCDLQQRTPGHDVDVLVNAYYRQQDTMLYEMDISSADWAQVVSNAAVVDLLTLMVQQRGWDAPAHHWDFTTITLCSLLTSLVRSHHRWGSTKVALLGGATLRLLAAVREFCLGVERECERRRPSAHVAALGREWRDIFEPDTTASLYELVSHILGAEGGAMSAARASMLTGLAGALGGLRWAALSAARRTGGLAPGELAAAGASALLRPAHPALKYVAFALLATIAEPLVLADSQKLKEWSAENQSEAEQDSEQERERERERPPMALDYFGDTYRQLQDVVEAALASVELGDTCELASLSDSHSMALGWLLLGELRARLGELARGDLTHIYIQIYRDSKCTGRELGAALRLLPRELSNYAYDTRDAAPAPPMFAPMFTDVAPFDMRAACQGAGAAALACRAVFWGVSGAGCGAARSWWSALRPRDARALERLVAQYVAPRVVREQLAGLLRGAHELADCDVRVLAAAREVTCALRVEDTTVELQVWLARAHPLTPPRLSTPALSGPATTHWLALYLAYQNGTLLNALKMWVGAVSTRVERAPHCYICYCRLQPRSGQLPRVPCHQCNNRFHTMCLRKWFATSNRSNCPLCRANF